MTFPRSEILNSGIKYKIKKQHNFRYQSVEMRIDDQVISKTSSSFNLNDVPNYQINFMDAEIVETCNDCEKVQIGSKIKFLWQGSYHAQIARVDIDYIPLPGKL